MTPGTCGRRQGTVLASYDRDSRSWKTSQVSLLTGTFSEYSETWPNWGMIVNGELSEQMTLALLTEGKGSGLWPTPQAMDSIHRSRESYERIQNRPRQGKMLAKLADIPHRWPTEQVAHGGTPTRQTYPTPTREDYRRRGPNSKQQGLPEQFPKEAGQLNPEWVCWLMGWPVHWTNLEPLSNREFQEWLQMSGIESQS